MPLESRSYRLMTGAALILITSVSITVANFNHYLNKKSHYSSLPTHGETAG